MPFSNSSMARTFTAQWQRILRHRRLVLALFFSGIGLRVFAEMAEELREGSLSPFDQMIFNLIRPWHACVLTEFAEVISALVVWPAVVFLALPFILYLAVTRRFIMLWGFVIISASTTFIVDLLKLIFHRHRPLTALVTEIGNSFPSGHATGSTVFYGLLGYIACRYWVRRRWARVLLTIFTIVLILLTGLARVYLEVHYPSDVIAGWAAGTCLLFAGIILLEYFAPDHEKDVITHARSA